MCLVNSVLHVPCELFAGFSVFICIVCNVTAIAPSRCRGKGLECAAAGDHVAAVAGRIQACTEDGTVPQIIRQRKLSATVALTLV